MSLLEAIVLGIVQGAAEFLPISSSGHLVLVPWWLGWDNPPVAFDVAVHVGTAFAIVLYFWRDWIALPLAGLQSIRQRSITTVEQRLFWYVIVGNVPVGLLGLALADYFDTTFSEPAIVAAMLFVTAGLLIFSERWHAESTDIEKMRWADALFIGLAQGLAIMPGISRSGTTIAAGLVRGLTREASARYSFLLATPIILAAGARQVWESTHGTEAISMEQAEIILVGAVTSMIVGYMCIAFLLRFIRQQPLYIFAAYCVIFGGTSLIAALA